jgi:hypothetical protein
MSMSPSQQLLNQQQHHQVGLDTVYRCAPRHSPYGVPVLATSSTTWCAGSGRLIHRVDDHRFLT